MATVTIQKRARKKKRTTYRVFFKEPMTGKKKYYKTFQRLRDAQQAANDLRALLDAGKLPEYKEGRLRLMTIRQVGESLKSEWDQRVLQGTLSVKAHSDYCCWLGVLVRIYGKRLLCQISRSEMQSHINGLACEHTVITANKYLSILRKVFRHGLGLRAVTVDPTAEIRRFSEKSHERNEFLLPERLNRLVAATQKSRAKFYMPAVIYLGAEHGASNQEILSLRWPDIDFDFNEAGLIRFYRTKNRKERVEFLMPRTRDALLKWRSHLEWKRRRERVTSIKSDRVFCRIDGTPLQSFSKAWRATLEEAGIKDFHFHDLRHTFCSNLILAGASLKDVKEMIGHSDISMTDRYSHLTLTHMMQKQEQLANHYMNGAQTSSGGHIGVTEPESNKKTAPKDDLSS
jgi:integrase